MGTHSIICVYVHLQRRRNYFIWEDITNSSCRFYYQYNQYFLFDNALNFVLFSIKILYSCNKEDVE